MGKPRSSGAYDVGENIQLFHDSSTNTFDHADGDTIAVGFLDANTDESGSETGYVIPFDIKKNQCLG